MNVLGGPLELCSTDPMTGFFAVRTAAIDVAALRPRGFKILLEILARNKVEVVEEPALAGQEGGVLHTGEAGHDDAPASESDSTVSSLSVRRRRRILPTADLGMLSTTT